MPPFGKIKVKVLSRDANQSSSLAPNSIPVAIKVMRVGGSDHEVPIRDVCTIQVGRRRRDADVRIGGVAVLLRQRWRPGRGVRYVGLLASLNRGQKNLQTLRERGVPEDYLTRVKTPVGIDIGARVLQRSQSP